MTTYFVSGFMRSGTSMMMKALEAGGMKVARSQKRDAEMNEKWGDHETGYVPNEEYYELYKDDYQDPKFPSQYKGQLIKCLYGGIWRINPEYGPYKVVFMRRDQNEIKMSMIGAFGSYNDYAASKEFNQNLDNIVKILKDRKSFISVIELNYADIIKNPIVEFEKLADDGWPIDPIDATSIVKPNKKRFNNARNHSETHII